MGPEMKRKLLGAILGAAIGAGAFIWVLLSHQASPPPSAAAAKGAYPVSRGADDPVDGRFDLPKENSR